MALKSPLFVHVSNINTPSHFIAPSQYEALRLSKKRGKTLKPLCLAEKGQSPHPNQEGQQLCLYFVIASVDSIRKHYDELSSKYLEFWGEHIHHGYWEDDESAQEAQDRLIRVLAERAQILQGAKVLDVGCGLGGSSLWLARHLDCEVLGITISPVQVQMATNRAAEAGLSGKVQFQAFDANELRRLPGSFDAVWIIEASEHILDKASLFHSCATLLRPAGRIALCAWTMAESCAHDQLAILQQVCDRMLCPNLGMAVEYVRWMQTSGFESIIAEDITDKTAPTWKFCLDLLRRPEVKRLLMSSPKEIYRFVAGFRTMHRAYAERAMGYHLFAARKASV
jgi:tocopherol O-methyltransferase